MVEVTMMCKISNLPIIFSPTRMSKQSTITRKTLTWDGSFLGEYPSSILGTKIATNRGLILRTVETKTFRAAGCFKCPRDTSIPCILDELKACFDLPKIGTHRIKIGGRMYIIYHNRLSDWSLNKLSKSQIDKLDKVKMQRLISFRFLFSVPHSKNSSFVFRSSTGEIYSFNEPKTYLGECTVDPSERFIKNWFKEIDFRKSVLSILPKSDNESIENFLFSFRWKIEKIIERIDSNYVWLTSYIIEKIAKLSTEIE